MTFRSDDMLAELRSHAIPEGLLAFYQSNGAVSGKLDDAEYEFLIHKGATAANVNDMWLEVLAALGYTGTMQDMLSAFWAAGGGVASRVIRGRVGTDFDIWNNNITGVGTIVSSGTNNTIIAVVNDATFRTYKAESYTVTAGQAYALSVDIDAMTGGADDKCKLLISVAITSGDASAIINTSDVGTRMCIKFVPTSTGVCSFRLGFGADGASAAGTATFSNIFVQELDSFASNPDDFMDLGIGILTDRTITDLVCNNTINASNQIVASAYTNQITHMHSSGIAVGDSLVNTEEDWPIFVEDNLLLDTRIWIKGVGGDLLADTIIALPNILILDGEDSRKSTPKYVFVSAGGNDVKNAASDPKVQMKLDYATIADLILGANMRPIFIEITPFKNNVNWTAAKQVYLDDMNIWLAGFCTDRGFDLAPLNLPMEDDITPDALKLAYDFGDGVHFNAVGNQQAADTLDAYV